MIKTWQDSDISIDGEYLKIQGHPVMEEWERPYMARLAEIATSKGGRVLELGFGMAISATAIQTHTIAEHHIIEANNQQVERAKEWAKTTAKSKVEVLHGFSWDVSPKLAE